MRLNKKGKIDEGVLIFILFLFILFLLGGGGAIIYSLTGQEIPLKYEISLSPANKITKGEEVKLFFKVVNNLNEIVILNNITYKSPISNIGGVIDLNDKTLSPSNFHLESRTIYTNNLDEAIYPISTTLTYTRGNSTKQAELSLNLEVYR